jgi:hypothetical protein
VYTHLTAGSQNFKEQILVYSHGSQKYGKVKELA